MSAAHLRADICYGCWTLIVGLHVCVHWHDWINIYLMAVGWTASSSPYMLAGMLGAHIYFMAVGWTTHSEPTYMLAGMLGVHIYLMAVGWDCL